ADILWRNDSGTLAEWQMNNGQILAGPQIASTPDLSWHVIGTGDFNGDHKTDILWRNDSGTLAEWTMDGAQVLAGPQIGSIPDATWKTVAHHYDFV
ncbi:FG-GAP repeat domain-containing protein, partial [Bradyrhizobium sp.]